MSGMYYRVDPPTRGPTDGYGFKKVTQEQLNAIVSRLATPTYNSRIDRDDSHTMHNYRHAKSAPPPRSPSACARRYSVGSQRGQIMKGRKLTEQDMQRVVRRLRRPTTASQLHSREYDYMVDDYSPPLERIGCEASSFFDASDRQKAFEQLSRPTTASRGKRKVDYSLCIDDDFDYSYAPDEKVVNAQGEELTELVTRVSSPTRASARALTCWKAPPDTRPLHAQSHALPLVSGLDRSSSVQQIVRRLHPHSSSHSHSNSYSHSNSHSHSHSQPSSTSSPSPSGKRGHVSQVTLRLHQRRRAPEATQITIFQ